MRRFGDGGASLADVGESTLLELLVGIAGGPGGAARGGDGDDAYAWASPGGVDLATSIDVLVEDVDFRRDWITPEQLGRRAFAVAASDMAGSGADPLWCVATLCARPEEQLEDVLALQRGLCEAAAEAGCRVAGGDVSATSGPLTVDVCVTGTLPAGSALRRSAGSIGDLLLLTGTVGRAAAGLRLLRDEASLGSTAERAWVAAQLEPSARLLEGRALLAAGVACGGDVSDGLLIDAARTARASGCGADIWVDALPVDAELRGRFDREWLQFAVGGGEDFELLAAVDPLQAPALVSSWPGDCAPLHVVGELRAGDGVRLLEGRGGAEVEAPRPSARHFA